MKGKLLPSNQQMIIQLASQLLTAIRSQSVGYIYF